MQTSAELTYTMSPFQDSRSDRAGEGEGWQQMGARKDLIRQYRERHPRGGVYKITNTRNGKRLLCHAVDIQAAQNRHDFLVATDCCIYPKLEDDWKRFGATAFVFEALEVIEMKQGQKADDFEADLTMLEQLWRERLGASDEY